jgi:hypothetical protein
MEVLLWPKRHTVMSLQRVTHVRPSGGPRRIKQLGSTRTAFKSVFAAMRPLSEGGLCLNAWPSNIAKLPNYHRKGCHEKNEGDVDSPQRHAIILKSVADPIKQCWRKPTWRACSCMALALTTSANTTASTIPILSHPF